MKKFIITESEKTEILKMYGAFVEDKKPFEKLMECRFTSDGKYVVFEGKAFLTETGEQVPLNEEWTLSDILHTGADILSVGLDFVIPGSGAVIDVLNAISYIIEAQFKSDEEKDSLYLMAAITFAFVIIPGPLQAIAVPLKRAIKTGVGMTSKVVVNGLKIISGALETLLLGIPSKVNAALKSPLAKNILGTWSGKISGFIDNFTTRIKSLLSKLTGKTGKEGSEFIGKMSTKEADFIIFQRLTNTTAGPVTKEVLPAIVTKTSHLSSQPVVVMKNSPTLFNKMGIKKGTSFRIEGSVSVVDDIFEDAIVISTTQGGKTKKNTMKAWDFIKTYILKPSAKLNDKYVPAITKILMRCLTPEGQVNDEINKISEISPDAASKELEYLSEIVSEYQGDSKKYTVETNVKLFQDALQLLGYKLPKSTKADGTFDGKFGPETKQQLEKFQNDNSLTSSSGKMDRITARKLSELLKGKNIEGSEELQKSLNSI